PVGVLSVGRCASCARVGVIGADGGDTEFGARCDGIPGKTVAARWSPSGSATSPLPTATPNMLGGVACSVAVAPAGSVIAARAAEVSRQEAMIRCQPERANLSASRGGWSTGYAGGATTSSVLRCFGGARPRRADLLPGDRDLPTWNEQPTFHGLEHSLGDLRRNRVRRDGLAPDVVRTS